MRKIWGFLKCIVWVFKTFYFICFKLFTNLDSLQLVTLGTCLYSSHQRVWKTFLMLKRARLHRRTQRCGLRGRLTPELGRRTGPDGPAACWGWTPAGASTSPCSHPCPSLVASGPYLESWRKNTQTNQSWTGTDVPENSSEVVESYLRRVTEMRSRKRNSFFPSEKLWVASLNFIHSKLQKKPMIWVFVNHMNNKTSLE